MLIVRVIIALAVTTGVENEESSVSVGERVIVAACDDGIGISCSNVGRVCAVGHLEDGGIVTAAREVVADLVVVISVSTRLCLSVCIGLDLVSLTSWEYFHRRGDNPLKHRFACTFSHMLQALRHARGHRHR